MAPYGLVLVHLSALHEMSHLTLQNVISNTNKMFEETGPFKSTVREMYVYYRHTMRSRQCWTGAAAVVTANSACAYLLSRPAKIISKPTRGLHVVRTSTFLIYTKSACYTVYASIYLEGLEKVTGVCLVDRHYSRSARILKGQWTSCN